MGDLQQNPMLMAMLMQAMRGGQGGSVWGNQSSMGGLLPLLMGLSGQSGITSPFQNTGNNWLSQILGMTGNTIGQTGGTASPQGTPNYATQQQSDPLSALMQLLGMGQGQTQQTGATGQSGGTQAAPATMGNYTLPPGSQMISNNSAYSPNWPVQNGLRMPNPIDPWASGANYTQEEAWRRNYEGTPYGVFANPWAGTNATPPLGAGAVAGALGLTPGGGGQTTVNASPQTGNTGPYPSFTASPTAPPSVTPSLGGGTGTGSNSLSGFLQNLGVTGRASGPTYQSPGYDPTAFGGGIAGNPNAFGTAQNSTNGSQLSSPMWQQQLKNLGTNVLTGTGISGGLPFKRY